MARLEHISNELFEMIVALLDYKSICSLRLVSQEISAKTNQKTLQSFFETVRVPLTIDDLEALPQATSGFLGHCVKNLILVGIVYDLVPVESYVKRCAEGRPPPRVTPACSKMGLSQVQRELSLLQEQRAKWKVAEQNGRAAALLRSAFDHISDHSSCLDRLSFGVEVMPKWSVCPRYPSRAPKEKAKAASETLALGLLGLEGSRLTRLKALDIYSSSSTAFCLGVRVDALSRILDRSAAALGLLFSNVHSLSINFADPQTEVPGMSGKDVPADLQTDIDAKQEQFGAFFGLSGLLASCCNLEALRIGHRRLSPGLDVCWHCQCDMVTCEMRHLTKQVKLPQLHKLHIDRVNLKDEDLAKLLLCFSGSLESLDLTSMNIDGLLTTGLAPVTDGRCPCVKRLFMDDLRQDSFFIRWNQEGQNQELPVFHEEEYSPTKNSIRRYGEDVRKPLLYDLWEDSEDEFICGFALYD